MPHKRSAFIVLVRETDRHVYCVQGTKGNYGVPGGKGEPSDKDDFTVAAREFHEETGAIPPGVRRIEHDKDRIEYVAVSDEDFYPYVAWGDRYHNCAFFYRVVSAEVGRTLPTGKSPDPQGAEQWVFWENIHSIWKNLRNHVRTGISLVQKRDYRILRQDSSSRSNSRPAGSRSNSRLPAGSLGRDGSFAFRAPSVGLSPNEHPPLPQKPSSSETGPPLIRVPHPKPVSPRRTILKRDPDMRRLSPPKVERQKAADMTTEGLALFLQELEVNCTACSAHLSSLPEGRSSAEVPAS